MLEFKDSLWVGKIFCGGIRMGSGSVGDVMGYVAWDEEKSVWVLSFRLRIHVDDKAFESKDPKYWKTFVVRRSRNDYELVEVDTQNLIKHMTKDLGLEDVEIIDIQASGQESIRKFKEKAKNSQYFQYREYDKEEAIKRGLIKE